MQIQVSLISNLSAIWWWLRILPPIINVDLNVTMVIGMDNTSQTEHEKLGYQICFIF